MNTKSGLSNNPNCIDSGYCKYAKHHVINTPDPAPKYIDGFICALTGEACVAKRYQLDK